MLDTDQPKLTDILKDFDVTSENKPLNIGIVGLGATGSSFIPLLGQWMMYNSNINIRLFDFDHIESHNDSVSMYAFRTMIIDKDHWNHLRLIGHSHYKVHVSEEILKQFSNFRQRDNGNTIVAYPDMVSKDYLERNASRNKFDQFDIIFIFADNNQARHEIMTYQETNPTTVIYDVRIGTYREFEIIMSKNAEKFKKTIYYNDDGSVSKINPNGVCLNERMSFSIAMSSSALLMNLFLQSTHGDMKKDFYHFMYGNDYKGEIKGY